MKIRTVALAVITLSSAVAGSVATAGSAPAGRPLTLAEVVAHMESSYPGRVIAIQYDASGDKGAHYHVDMRFPESGIARVDVDAVTRRIAARDPVPLVAGSATLAEAAAFVAAHVSGHVTVAELDSTYGVAPHYDVDVRLPQGDIARLKVDPATRAVAWRNPAIVAE